MVQTSKTTKAYKKLPSRTTITSLNAPKLLKAVYFKGLFKHSRPNTHGTHLNNNVKQLNNRLRMPLTILEIVTAEDEI